MPFRSETTIRRWVTEFLDLGYDERGTVRVIGQDPLDGENSGLVIVALQSISTSIYIQPAQTGSTLWLTTLEEELTAREFTASQLAALSAELIMVSALTAFLEAKSMELTAEKRSAGTEDTTDD